MKSASAALFPARWKYMAVLTVKTRKTFAEPLNRQVDARWAYNCFSHTACTMQFQRNDLDRAGVARWDTDLECTTRMRMAYGNDLSECMLRMRTRNIVRNQTRG